MDEFYRPMWPKPGMLGIGRRQHLLCEIIVQQDSFQCWHWSGSLVAHASVRSKNSIFLRLVDWKLNTDCTLCFYVSLYLCLSISLSSPPSLPLPLGLSPSPLLRSSKSFGFASRLVVQVLQQHDQQIIGCRAVICAKQSHHGIVCDDSLRSLCLSKKWDWSLDIWQILCGQIALYRCSCEEPYIEDHLPIQTDTFSEYRYSFMPLHMNTDTCEINRFRVKKSIFIGVFV